MCSRHQPENGADSAPVAPKRQGLTVGLKLPKGVQVLPGTFQGVRGPARGSQGGFWSPVGVKTADGGNIVSWYCHGYKTADEHYHVNQPQMDECKRLRGEEVGYAD